MACSAVGKHRSQLGPNASWLCWPRRWLLLGALLVFVQLACTPGTELGDADFDASPSDPTLFGDGTSRKAAADASEGGAAIVSSADPVPTTQAGQTPPTTSTTASLAESTGAVGPPQPDGWLRNLPDFHQGRAPQWPFVGVVQLWRHDHTARHYDEDLFIDGSTARWWLLYLGLDAPTGRHPAVPLPGLTIECMGRVALVSHGAGGLEVGGSVGDASGSVVIPWGQAARPVGEPSAALLDEVRHRPSNVPFDTQGDVVTVGVDAQQEEYAMRMPPRIEGRWWQAQIRQDGELLVMNVQPFHLPCLNGVTWVSDAATGQVLACGTNTPATRLVAPRSHPVGMGVPALPDPEIVGGVLDCAARLDLPYLAKQYAQAQ